jgi:hypothetical protein
MGDINADALLALGCTLQLRLGIPSFGFIAACGVLMWANGRLLVHPRPRSFTRERQVEYDLLTASKEQ